MPQQVDRLAILGWGMLLMPLLTMAHEIGGHAAFCVAQGGHVAALGAFYVDCRRLDGVPSVLVACAGVLVNAVAALAAHALWRRARGDRTRLALWLIWVSEAFVAAGYFCFSGATGFGDLGTGRGGSLTMLPMPLVWRVAELAFGIAAYVVLVRVAIRTLATMIGTGPATRVARRRIAHGYYLSVGLAAVLVGLLNPLGWMITLMSAAASSFGGLAGFISIGFAERPADEPRRFVLPRDWFVVTAGAAVLLAFALVLGPSLRF